MNALVVYTICGGIDRGAPPGTRRCAPIPPPPRRRTPQCCKAEARGPPTPPFRAASPGLRPHAESDPAPLLEPLPALRPAPGAVPPPDSLPALRPAPGQGAGRRPPGPGQGRRPLARRPRCRTAEARGHPHTPATWAASPCASARCLSAIAAIWPLGAARPTRRRPARSDRGLLAAPRPAPIAAPGPLLRPQSHRRTGYGLAARRPAPGQTAPCRPAPEYSRTLDGSGSSPTSRWSSAQD
jgi:hypothetical protein